jgi:hypothetical protein
MYKPTHQNHPSVVWASHSYYNWLWTIKHGFALCEEYEYRFNKEHACLAVIQECFAHVPKFVNEDMTAPAQAMPDEYKIPGDPIGAYRAYYLGRKVEQSRWTRRPAPAFVPENEMAKKPAKVPAAVQAEAAAVISEAKATSIGVKGPRGVDLNAAVTLLTSSNPKRTGSAAWARFEGYVDGATVQATMDAGITTADLIYDAAHGYIAIEGYAPALIERKERAPKVEKPAKPAKAKKVKAEPTEAQKELDDAMVEETID